MVRADGIEPSTFALSEQRSTTELRAQKSEPRSNQLSYPPIVETF